MWQLEELTGSIPSGWQEQRKAIYPLRWFDLVGPLVADRFRVIAVDWRGCSASDKPVPLFDYSNYMVRQHADVGHSMLIERPEMYAQYFVEFFHRAWSANIG